MPARCRGCNQVGCRFAATCAAGHRQEATRSGHGEVKKVQQAIDLLPHGWRMAMRTQKLDRAIAQSEELSASITATRSGGSAEVQTIALKKDVAAAQALDLLAKYGDGCRPTTNPDGKFYRIARLLSGQKSDMARACASALSDK